MLINNLKSNFMKKIIIALFAFSFLAYAGCRKRDTEEGVSMTVEASYPVITFTGSKFVSIPVGGTVPSIAATAFDSVLNENIAVQQGPSTVDVNTPGLYFQEFVAKNSNGYRVTAAAYVAVTNVPESANLAGLYKRTGNNAEVNLTEVANGLYETDNLFGSPPGGTFATAYFVHVDDTTISMPEQPTSLGTLITDGASLHMAPGDTTYSYKIMTLTSNNVLRTFVKQ
jgi:hypothetical protein